MSRTNTEAVRFTFDVCASAGRYFYRAAALGSIYNNKLSPELVHGEARLSKKSGMSDDPTVLGSEVAMLAGEAASFAEKQAQLNRLSHNIEADLQNLQNLISSEGIPIQGWFRRSRDKLAALTLQTDFDENNCQITWNRATAILSSISTKAEIIRANQEKLQSTQNADLSLKLTSLGILIGLANVIDKEHSAEFIQWVNAFDFYLLPVDGITLLTTRILLILASGGIALGLFKLLFRSLPVRK